MKSIIMTLILCCWGASWIGATEVTFTVAREGAAQTVIVTDEGAPEPVHYAAKRLQSYLQRITGAVIPIAHDIGEGNGTHIFVGDSRFTRAAGIDPATEEQEYRMEIHDGDLILLGEDDTVEAAIASVGSGHAFCDAKLFQKIGTVYAVNDFLYAAGVRWYLPGELGEVVPEDPNLEVMLQPVRRKPSVAHRNFHAYGWLRQIPKYFDIQYNDEFGVPREPYLTDVESLDWARALKMGGRPFSGGHGQMDYFARFGATHPEWFANARPEEGGQLCYSNPELKRQIIQDACDFLDGKFAGTVTFSAGNYFSVMPADNQNWCRCDSCRKLFPDLPARGLRQPPSRDYAAKYVWFHVAEIARMVAQTHPEARIVCCAYADYSEPPEDLQLPENVTVFLCQTHSAYAPDPAATQTHAEWVRRWQGHTRDIVFWDYFLWPVSPTFERFPATLPHAIADQVALMRELGLNQGFMAQMSETVIRNLAFDHLRIYITARLLDDWELSVDALLEEYYRLFYGPAEQPMRTFWSRLELIYLRERQPGTAYRDAEYDWMCLVTEADLAQLEADLQEAAGQVEADSVFARRIALMRSGIYDWLTAARARIIAQIAVTRQAVIPRLAPVVQLTGDLAAPEWRQAAVLDDWQFLAGGEADLETSARVFHDGANLYVGIRCVEPDMAGVRAERTAHDDDWLFRDDSVELFIDVGRKLDDKEYFHLSVNSAGVLRDSFCRNGVTWESEAEIATARDAEGWSVEMRIPLRSLEVSEVKKGDRWGLNVCRNRPVRRETPSVMQNENYTFYHWNGPFGYHNPMRFGIIEMQ